MKLFAPMQKVHKVQKASTEARLPAVPAVSAQDLLGEPPTKAAKNRLHPGGRRNFEINPMKNYATRPGDLKKQQRCGARTRAGAPCQRPPILGRTRCRLHGGLSPGAPRGSNNGNFKTGDWTAEAIAERKWLRSLVQSFAKSGTTE
jgi:hypothetical protein